MAQTQKPRYVTVDEFCQVNKGRLGRNSIYSGIAAGTIPSVRVGRRILVPEDAFERMLAQSTVDGKGE